MKTNSNVVFAFVFVLLFGAVGLFASAPQIDDSHIEVSAVDYGITETTAIVGTEITVDVTDPDNAGLLEFDSATVDFSNFGGSDTAAMTGPDADGIWTASYIIMAAGSAVGDTIDATDLSLSVTATNADGPTTVEDDVTWTVDNQNPVAPADTTNSVFYLSINGESTKTSAMIGDEIDVNFNYGSDSEIYGMTVDFGVINGEEVTVYAASRGILTASYEITDTTDTTSNAQIEITAIFDDAGNNILGPTVSGAQNDPLMPISVDSDPPDLATAVDIADVGYLRFSPDSPSFADYWDVPDTLQMTVTLPDWGDPGGASQFTIRIIDPDADAIIGYKTYEIGDAELDETNAPDLTFYWDGTDPDDGTICADNHYGLTLWSVKDEAGNEAITGHAPTGLANITNGITAINNVQAVLDDTPPEFTANANQTDDGLSIHNVDDHAEKYVIERYVIDDDNNNEESVGDEMTDCDEVYFQFGVTRWFVENTNLDRHEFVKYWITVESDSTDYDTHYFQGTFGDHGSTTFDQAVNPTNVFDVNNTTNAFAAVGENGTITFYPFTANYTAGNSFEFPEGDYMITAYIQDNAGNIASNSKDLEIVNEYFTAPEITSVEITSEHSGGANQLAPYSGGDHNFYVTSGTPAYYNTNDDIEFEIEVADVGNVVSVEIDANALNLGTITKYPADFVGNTLTISWEVDQFAQSLASATPGTSYQIGGLGDIDIQIYGNDGNSVGSSHFDRFNLIIPEAPQWPSVTSNIDVDPQYISPGDPNWSYNASSNPAHDGNDESSDISFTISASNVDYDWVLTIENEDGDQIVRSDSVRTPWNAVNYSYTYTGLDDNYDVFVPATATQTLNIELECDIADFGDDGYVDPPGNIYDDEELVVDNTNPQILNVDGSDLIEWDMDGDGTPDPEYAGHLDIDEIPVNENDPTFQFTIQTSEPLLADFGTNTPGDEWSVLVTDIAGNTISGSGGDVEATITNISQSGYTGGGFTQFTFDVELSNLTGLENLDAVLILRAINDFAGNPNRVNDPPYPFDADTYHDDSAEAYVKLMILKNEPGITSLSFAYDNSTTHIALPNNPNNPNTFDLEVEFTGYPGLAPTDSVSQITYSADFSAFTGVSAPAGVLTDLGGNNYKVEWNNVQFSGFNSATTTGTLVPIPVTIDLGFDPVSGHEYSATDTFNAILDVTDPTITVNDPTPVPSETDMLEGNTYNIAVNIADANAGTYPTSATLTCDTDPAIGPTLISANANQINWSVTIPADYGTRILNFTATIDDNVANINSATKTWDIGPIPTIANVDITNDTYPATPDWLQNGQDIELTFDLTDLERIDNAQVMMNTDFRYGATTYNGTMLTIPVGSLSNGSNTFTLQDINNSGTLNNNQPITATVQINHPYDHNTDSSTDQSDNSLKVDNLDPVISNITFDQTNHPNITITADVEDNYAGVDQSAIELDLTGIDINISNQNPDSFIGGTATWNIIDDSDTPAVDNGIMTVSATDRINNGPATLDKQVDTQPIINDITVFVNGDSSDVITRDGGNIVTLQAEIEATTDQLDAIDIDLSVEGVLAPNDPILVNTAAGNSPETSIYTYEWDDSAVNYAAFAALVFDNGYEEITFSLNVESRYGFEATPYPYNKDIIVIDNYAVSMYGEPGTDYIGYDPDGWFAPEHDVHTEYTVYSTLDNINIEADFDEIVDNVPEEWIEPTTPINITSENITIEENGVNTTITLYTHEAIWDVDPDVQSVWNAYDDGEIIDIDFRYDDPFSINQVEFTENIQVDLEVPKYEDFYNVGNLYAYGAASMYTINALDQEVDFSLAVDPGNLSNTWLEGSIYLDTHIEDYNGVGFDTNAITTPTVSAGWSIAQEIVNDDNVVWKITPDDSTAVNDGDQLQIQLNRVEDLVGHYNYDGPSNSTSGRYEEVGPVITMNFTEDYNDINLSSLQVFQIDDAASSYAEYTDNATSPYLTAGGRVGVMLQLAPTDDVTITVDGISIFDDYFNNDTDSTWVELDYNAADDLYYLANPLFVDNAIGNGPMDLRYRIVYKIEYTDPPRPDEIQEFVSGDVSGYIVVDNNSPEFVTDGIYIWSETLGAGSEGYVTPGDNDGNILVLFTDEHDYINNTVPTVTIDDMDTFTTLPASYDIPADDIGFYDNYENTALGINETDVWVALLDDMEIQLDDPDLTSQVISVTLEDAVGNASAPASRFVEITGNGPLVPMIRHAELITTLPEGDELTDYMANSVDAELKIYVDCEYSSYIEEMWITDDDDAITGVDTMSVTSAQISQLVPPLHNATWLATVPITPDNISALANGTLRGFTAHTKRHPFGATPVFEDEFNWDVTVDGNGFEIQNVTLFANPNNVNNWINPDEESFTIEADLIGINEFNGLNIDAWDLTDWFVLENGNDVVLDTYVNAPVITGTGADRHAVWTVNAADLDADLVNLTDAELNINYRNIYGLDQDETFTFDIDNEAPQPDFDGVTYTYPPTEIMDDTDWISIQIPLADAGSGIFDATMEITARPETPVDPVVLADLNANLNLDIANGIIELSFANYSAHDLAEGYYDITIEAWDNVVNNDTFVEQFYYTWAPSTVQVFLDELQNYQFNTGDDDSHTIRALVNDPNGMVTGVEFQLYADANANTDTLNIGEDVVWTPDIVSNDGNPDPAVPYEATWNIDETLARYSYTDTTAANGWGTDATRRWFLRTLVNSNTDAVTDVVTPIDVTDNVAPIPEDITIPANITYDYETPANNNVTFSADCGNWLDDQYLEFNIYDDNNNLIETITVNIADPTIEETATVNWDFDFANPGDYTLEVVAYDYVGNNASDSQSFSIGTFGSNISYDLTMWNFDPVNWDDEVQIGNGTEFGPINEITTINELRLDAEFNNLDGASSIGFWYEKFDVDGNSLGTFAVTNDTSINPDFPADASNISVDQISGNIVRIVPTDDIYTNNGNYNGTDYTYQFYVVVTDQHLGDLSQHAATNNDAMMQVDYLAPTVTYNNGTDYVTWSQAAAADYTFDYTDADVDLLSPNLEWSLDGVNWTNAVTGLDVTIADEITFTDWMTEGGSIDKYVGGSYEGDVQLRAIVTDNMGNETTVPLANPVYVDNQAPDVPITHIAYGVDPNLTPLNGNDEIEIVYNPLINPQGSQLKMRVHQNDVDPNGVLSTTGIGEYWDNIPAWVTNPTTDLSSPLMLYHGWAADDNPANIAWDPGVMYDHEPDANGYYGFDILFENAQADYGYHYYAFVGKDFRGNIEGDVANDGTNPPATAYDGNLSPDELTAMYDLRVHVYSDEVATRLLAYNDNDIVGEYINLAAEVYEGLGYVDQVRFEYYSNTTSGWEEIGTTAADPNPKVYVHLYRSEIPGFDDLSFVPGIHLYNGNNELAELTWNGTDAWEDEVTLDATVNYNDVKFAADLDDNGVIDAGELANAFVHPNGFTNIEVSQFMAYLNTEDVIDGIYSFRAVALDAAGNVLYEELAETTNLHIDNTAPTAVMNTITSVENIQPNEILQMITNVDELLVADDDIITVDYQYSPQLPEDINGNPIQNRQWLDIGTSNQMSGQYNVDWAVDDPINDGIDNDSDGYIDEADEEDAVYYLRSYAHDVAGNYGYSQEYILNVDGSSAEMEIVDINGNLEDNNYIVQSADVLSIQADDITPFNFDPAITALFEYREVGAANWIVIDTVDASGSATVDFDATNMTEGYYEFKVTANDSIGNVSPGNIVTIIYDDIDPPDIAFATIDGQTLVSDQYLFTQGTTTNEMIVTLADPADVATVAFEYSTDNNTWINITSVAVAGANVSSGNWELPAGFDHIYLRAVGEDFQGNDNYTVQAELYLDNSAPSVDVDVNPLLTLGGNSVMDVENDNINFDLTYTNDALHNAINDVAEIEGKILNVAGQVVQTATTTNVNSIANMLTFDDFTGINDDIYGIEVTATDFAGNSTTITPAAFNALYLDRTAPDNLILTSTSHPNNMAVYNDTIDFELTFDELVGVDVNPMDIYITHDTIIDSMITNINIDNTTGSLTFTWTPSDDMQQFIIDGEMSINPDVEIMLRDYLAHEATLTQPDFFTLEYGIPLATQMLVVEDVVQGIDTPHYVNWNSNPPAIDEFIGGNNAKIFAYVPHLAEIPTNVEFFYQGPNDPDFVNIGFGVASGPTNWSYIDFLFDYQREYSIDWDITNVDHGTYEIKAVSYYDVGQSESIIEMDIYKDMIIPDFTVYDHSGNQMNAVERGETYDITVDGFNAPNYPAFVDEMIDSVRYAYRFVDAGSPISQWMYFGDVNGQPNETWIGEPYTFDWTVYPYYLFNHDMQIVAETKDIYGTETTKQDFIANGTSQIVHIEDNTAPEIFAVNIPQGNIINGEIWLGDINTAEVNAEVHTNVEPNDLDWIEIWYGTEMLAQETDFTTNDTITTANYSFDVPASSGMDSMQVKVSDVYGNEAEYYQVFHVDKDAPIADMAVEDENGDEVATLEREETVWLDANASDPLSGLNEVTYEYRMVTDPVGGWMPITTILAAPYEFEWDIPSDLEYGAYYEFQAIVTDNLNNQETSVSDSIEVTDQNTEITIDTIVGIAPVNGQITDRITGDIEIVSTVPAGQNIRRLEYLVRADGNANWRDLDPLGISDPDVFTHTVNIDHLVSGDYYIGVAPHELADNLADPVDSVMVTVDTDFAITVNSITPNTDGMFNGEEFQVAFTVDTDDEIDVASFAIGYKEINDTIWTNLNATSDHLFNGSVYTVTLDNLDPILPDKRYDFRFCVRDLALPVGNMTEHEVANILYDTGDPNVNFAQVNGITDFSEPIDIMIGQEVEVEADAYDALGGQIYLEASGIDKVVFSYVNPIGDSIYIGEANAEPYETTWNTNGYLVDDNYLLEATAFDNVGNFTELQIPIHIVAEAQPFAVISGFDFDEESANVDRIFAVTKDCVNNLTDKVRFEYSLNGTDWTMFAEAQAVMQTLNEVDLWSADFNADNMGIAGNDIMLRAVAVKQNGDDTDIIPELTATYSDDMGGMFILPTNDDAVIYYEDVVHIEQTVENVPFVTAMNEELDALQNTQIELLEPIVNTSNPMNFTADVNFALMNNQHGQNIDVWSAYVDDNNEIQLEKASLRVYNLTAGSGSNGLITSEDNLMTLNVPVDGGTGDVYFEPVHADDELSIPNGYVKLTDQEAIMGNAVAGLAESNFTMELTETPSVGDVMLTINGIVIPNVDVSVDGDVASFDMILQTGIYSIVQYEDVDLFTDFINIAPEFTDTTGDLWTMGGDGNVPVNFTFRTYTEYDPVNGTYVVPPAADLEISIFLNDLEIVHEDASYDPAAVNFNDIDPITGLYSIDILDDQLLTAGSHQIKALVMMNGYEVEVTTDFEVDETAPLITPDTNTQITAINRTISATISDDETDLNDVELEIIGLGGNNLIIGNDNLTMQGDVYSYELTMDQLYALGYQNGNIAEMDVVWTADNNVTLQNVMNVDYTVNLDGPAITFTGFDNGWWLNPTVNTDLTFEVEVADGNSIPADGVEVELFEMIDGVAPNPAFQTMFLNYTTMTGNVYEYALGFGQLLSPEATAVKLVVTATNNYNVATISEQTYGFDFSAPNVWAMSPVGGAIDNDGDGLFNEDPPNGINEDQDWDDLNNNGVWDWNDLNGNGIWDPGEGEPPIIDEDIRDFAPDTLMYGTDVVISIGFEDVPGYHLMGNQWYYTGASGIDIDAVTVTLNGDEISGDITAGTFIHDAGTDLDPGHYVVQASVGDYVGNIGSVAYEFEISGPAPTVEFIAPDAGWWINPQSDNTLIFEVTSYPDGTLADDGVVASVYTLPDTILIQGPATIAPNGNDQYEVNLNPGIIPAGQTGVRLQVMATNIWGNTSESNQSYGVDTIPPEITFISPEDGEIFEIDDNVHILANFTDIQGVADLLDLGETKEITKSRDDSEDSENGSGIAGAELVVTMPDGTDVTETTGEDITVIETMLNAVDQYGTYDVTLTVTDKVGNGSVDNLSFLVNPTAPTVTFNEFNAGWWFNPALNTESFTFDVNSPVTIDQVVVTFYGMPAGDILQGPQTVEPDNGNYSVNLGANVPSDYTGVVLEVSATDNYENNSVSSQTYGIDTVAPVITFISPEDGEIFEIDDNVHILANFIDMQEQPALRSDRKSASKVIRDSRDELFREDNMGSGIAEAVLKIYDPEGEVEEIVTNEQSIDQIITDLVYGTYGLVLTVSDKVGNQTMHNLEFYVGSDGPALTMLGISSENGYTYGNKFKPGKEIMFQARLTEMPNIEVLTQNIHLDIYRMFEYEEQIVFELIEDNVAIIDTVENGIHDIYYSGIPSIMNGDLGMQYRITASDEYGNISAKTQNFYADGVAPRLAITSPEAGMSYSVDVGTEETVTLSAEFEDELVGIGNITLLVDGVEIPHDDAALTLNENSLVYTAGYAAGDHTIKLTVEDNVMNFTSEVLTFAVIEGSIGLTEEIDAHFYPNPMETDGHFVVDIGSASRNSNIEIEIDIYDFSSKKVRTITATSGGEIAWDGRSDSGVKLGRGAYFARIKINDGQKEIVKLVKVAIK